MKDEPLYRNGITHAQADELIRRFKEEDAILEERGRKLDAELAEQERELEELVNREITRIASNRK